MDSKISQSGFQKSIPFGILSIPGESLFWPLQLLAVRLCVAYLMFLIENRTLDLPHTATNG